VSLPEDNLPDSLEKLYIKGCPLLEERYKRKEHWSKIAHIPVIDINHQVTMDQDLLQGSYTVMDLQYLG
jgi:hypothetical protein